MARRKGPRNYKIVNVATKSMGAAGGQILLGKIKKIDAQGPTAYLNNLRLSVLVDDAESDNIGFMAYLTTDNAWSDDYIISAAAGAVGGTMNLSAKRYISTNADTDVTILGNKGPIYLWLEYSNPGLSEDARYVAETWGRQLKFDEL